MLDAPGERRLAIDLWREVDQHVERQSHDTAGLQPLARSRSVRRAHRDKLWLPEFFFIGKPGLRNFLRFGSLLLPCCAQLLPRAAEHYAQRVERLFDSAGILLQEETKLLHRFLRRERIVPAERGALAQQRKMSAPVTLLNQRV